MNFWEENVRNHSLTLLIEEVVPSYVEVRHFQQAPSKSSLLCGEEEFYFPDFRELG